MDKYKQDNWPWDSVRSDGEIHADYLKKIWTSPKSVTNKWKKYSWMPGKEGESVLDIGCGHARFLDYFVNMKQMNYMGLDNSERMIEICKEKYPEYDFFKATIPQNAQDDTLLPFEDNFVDLVFCYDVLRHLFEAEKAVLPEFFRVAKKHVVVSQLVSLGDPVVFQHPHGTMEINRNVEDVHDLMDILAKNAKWSLPKKYSLYDIDKNRRNYVYVFKSDKE